jgi:hypothetical protein
MDTHERIVQPTVTIHHGIRMNANDEVVSIAETERGRGEGSSKEVRQRQEDRW